MTNTRKTAVKYLKIYILSLLFVFIIDYFINGNLMNDGRIIEYLFVDILPLSCIFIIGWMFEFILKKRYMKDFNLSLYFISSAVFIFIFVQLYSYINLLPEVTYQTYTHAGILIFLFAAGIFYLFKKNDEVKPAGYKILDTNKEENNNILNISPFQKCVLEIFLGFSSGITVLIYDFAYRLLKSI